MMNEKNTNIDDILTRLLGHEATDEEIVWFSTWILQEENKAYFMKFKKVWNLTNGRHATPEEIAAGLKKYRQFMLSSLRPRHYRRVIRHAAAAAAVILAGLFSIPQLMEEEPGVSPIPSPAAVPSKGGILTLADGSTVNVSQQDTFQMTTGEEAITIRKREDKEIVYAVNDTLDDGSAAQKPEYNRIVVPAGMRFSVQLSDGTKVWLNAESSLRYPTRFGKGTRQVEIQGNVYFEVAKDSARPFIVSAPQLTTEVLGTAFEVNTYGDHDEMSVTLVEGSVKVHSPLRTAIISPNQQFIYDMNKQQTIVVLVNAAEKVKWKDGILSIKHEPFNDVVWKLERWYGVTIENQTGETFPQAFSGEFDEEDIHMAMQVLCTHLDITYSMEKDRVILKKK